MSLMVDKYFSKTANCVQPDTKASYGVFLRHNVICAIKPALYFLSQHAPGAIVRRLYEEGAPVPAEKPLFVYSGPLKPLVTLETEMLMQVGVPCISAYNAYSMSLACKRIPFMDMHARHAAGQEMVMLAAYGASLGSKMAKLQGARGFIGSSLDDTAEMYGTPFGLGTMPHALVGLAGSTLEAVKLFVDGNPDDRMIVALVDYYGKEYTDAVEVGYWFRDNLAGKDGYKLGVRIDTHGARFAESLDWDKSVEIVGRWLHVDGGEWPIVRHVMGEDVFEIADYATRDRVRAILFGKGVSAAAIICMRQVLDQAGMSAVQIVASSGFNLRKCKIMAQVRAPIDMIGTGSFLPETMSETYATADIYEYNGVRSVKVGREAIFQGL